MIITRSPLRISLGGGGTDLPSYYNSHGGFLVAAGIDKYVYIILHKTYEPEFILKYSKMERTTKVEDIQHPIIRESLKYLSLTNPCFEIASMADVPAGTGLGSSGSFTTALLKALHVSEKRAVSASELAKQACIIELEKLNEPIGKQDQYAAAVSGITAFTFLPSGEVEARPLSLSEETRYNLEDNLLMFFTGISRSASTILKDQDQKSKTKDSDMIENLHYIKELGIASCRALEAGHLTEFAKLMDRHWYRKRERSQNISSGWIDECYEYAKQNGAIGGKIIGAGGGGFFLFYAEDKIKLRHALREKGLKELRFRFDFQGTSLVAES